MNILAFECSAKAASAALLCDGKLIAETYQNCGFTHSRTLLPLAEDMLKRAEKTFDDIDLYAVSSGPGSFTGLRIGISLVKGFAYGADKPCCGVSSLEAMAYMVPSCDSVVCAVMDARAGQVYNALFDVSDVVSRICDDRAITVESLKEELNSLGRKVIVIGDGSYLLENCGYSVLPAHMRYQRAFGVALCAYNSQGISSFELTPSYHRLPQAERERLARLNK